MILRKLSLCLAVFALPSILAAQDFVLSEQRHLINRPTAGSLARGSFDIELRMFPEGGVLGGVAVGLTDRITFGANYGGMNVIGEGPVVWNPKPEVNAKYRLIEETYTMPAIAVGFGSQGYGPWDERLKRYRIKSPGFYGAASKNYAFFGNFGLHAGVNYSLEQGDGDEDVNLYIGFDKSLNSELSVLVEYDFAVNDNEDNSLGSKKGYLNTAIRWTFVERLIIELDVTNTLGNRRDTASASRELKIIYVEYF